MIDMSTLTEYYYPLLLFLFVVGVGAITGMFIRSHKIFLYTAFILAFVIALFPAALLSSFTDSPGGLPISGYFILCGYAFIALTIGGVLSFGIKRILSISLLKW